MKIDWKSVGLWLIAFLAVEIFSFGGDYNLAAFATLVILVAILTAYRPEYGLLALLAELFMGSMGHLFYWEIAGLRLPLRIGMFAAVLAVFAIKFLVQLIRERRRAEYWQNLRSFGGKRYYLILGAAIVIGLVNAWLRSNGFGAIFDDINGWLYFLVIIPVAAVYCDADEGRSKRLQTVFIAAAIWLSLKTLFILFMFAHNATVAPAMYYWLRRILGGEVTLAAGWPRVFIQGQIFSAIAFLIVFWMRPRLEKAKAFFSRSNLSSLFLGALFLSSIVISLSRSFWVGFLAATGLSLVALWRLRSFRQALYGAWWLFSAAVLSLAFIYILLIIPFSQSPTAGLGSSLFDRVTADNEPALASRWALLPVLWEKIDDEPILGQGFGATVTYFSRDPRVLALSPSGEYTTYAFEWGYLDIWLKLGIVGLAAYLWLLGKLILDAWRRGIAEGNMYYLGLAAGLVFLAATNFFTPYLNHPLGIGFLAISSCLIWTNKVY